MYTENHYCHFFLSIVSPYYEIIFKLKEQFGSFQNAWCYFLRKKHHEYLIDKEKERTIIQKIPTYNQTKAVLYLKSKNIEMVNFWEEDYPALLKEIFNPPPLLYLIGRRELLKNDALAVVGSRHPSFYGQRAINHFLPSLIQSGLTIVSGLAYGIDASAHFKALDSETSTIAVLGGSVDHIFPAKNYNLYQKISRSGLIISEFPPPTLARSYYFPLRNRIISGLSIGSLVIEAAAKSGALITAHYANDQGREIFTIPGPFDLLSVQGNNNLIKNCQALAVTSPQEILEIVASSPLRKTAGSFTQIPTNQQRHSALKININHQKILNFLQEPHTTEELLQFTNNSPATLNSLLSEMEIQGLINRLPGARIVAL